MSRVLIAEDGHSVGQGLDTILATEGHEVTLTRSGPAAVAAGETAAFDVLLTDIDLPEADGYEFARCLRAKHPGIRVVVLSRSGTSTRVRLPEDACVLHKPAMAA